MRCRESRSNVKTRRAREIAPRSAPRARARARRALGRASRARDASRDGARRRNRDEENFAKSRKISRPRGAARARDARDRGAEALAQRSSPVRGARRGPGDAGAGERTGGASDRGGRPAARRRRRRGDAGKIGTATAGDREGRAAENAAGGLRVRSWREDSARRTRRRRRCDGRSRVG